MILLCTCVLFCDVVCVVLGRCSVFWDGGGTTAETATRVRLGDNYLVPDTIPYIIIIIFESIF